MMMMMMMIMIMIMIMTTVKAIANILKYILLYTYFIMIIYYISYY